MNWARKFLVAALTLALLAVPCLSAVNIFGSGIAHAHHAMSIPLGGDGQHGSHAGHMAGGESGHQSHAHMPPAGPEGVPEACCGLCVGWLTKSGSEVRVAAPVSDTVKYDVTSHSLFRAGAGSAMLRLSDVPCSRPDRSQVADGTGAPVYAQTARYRL